MRSLLVIALAKAKPGAMHFGSPAIGGAAHLAGELFKRQAGIDVVHVAYKGGGPAALVTRHLVRRPCCERNIEEADSYRPLGRTRQERSNGHATLGVVLIPPMLS
jgi:tripartite-type tricarboxylate transporter receptor subunit TctC